MALISVNFSYCLLIKFRYSNVLKILQSKFNSALV